MATSWSLLTTFNRALLAQGWEEIAEGDGSEEWRVLNAAWPEIIEAELEDGAYQFTRKTANLVTRVDGSYGFNDKFLLPADCLHVRRVWIEEAVTSTSTTTGLEEDEPDTRRLDIAFVQDESYVYVNKAEGCWIEYTYVPDTSLFGASFIKGVNYALQAVILRAFKEEYGEAEAMDRKAMVQFQRARTISSKGRSNEDLFKDRGQFVSARHRPLRY